MSVILKLELIFVSFRYDNSWACPVTFSERPTQTSDVIQLIEDKFDLFLDLFVPRRQGKVFVGPLLSFYTGCSRPTCLDPRELWSSRRRSPSWTIVQLDWSTPAGVLVLLLVSSVYSCNQNVAGDLTVCLVWSHA